MSVWVTIPSARPPEVVAEWAKAWRERGYKIALWRDDLPDGFPEAEFTLCGVYPGYAQAVNRLIAQLLTNPHFEWAVIGGDDVFPDPDHSAEEIAKQCGDYFADL